LIWWFGQVTNVINFCNPDTGEAIMDKRDKLLIEQAQFLILRLERLSVDSIYAHRASGFRGALLKHITYATDINRNKDLFQNLIDAGYEILVKAAREM
jgi:hypothetical protein